MKGNAKLPGNSGDIGDEAMRRGMVNYGLDASNPDDREMFEDTTVGQVIKMHAHMDRLGRLLIEPVTKLLDLITPKCDPEEPADV